MTSCGTMKVLLCERVIQGHRGVYLGWLSKIPGIETFVFAPEAVGVDAMHYIRYVTPEKNKSAREYLNWIRSIRNISKEKGIDVVHILDGDSIMRFFGLGLNSIKTAKMIITYHHFFDGELRKIAYKMMCFGKRKFCVVHTNSVLEKLKRIGIYNVEQCCYPSFSFESISRCNHQKSKLFYGLSDSSPVIGIVGGMCQYKNIIPYLKALRDVKSNFQVLICGKTVDIGEDEIKDAVSHYSDRVKMVLRQLSEEEYEMAIAASDIIYCVYNYTFDGASGPLTDAVCADKQILACEHGSLGEIVRDNHLGVTAECTDIKDMQEKTIAAVNSFPVFRYDEVACKYKETLNPRLFQDKYKKLYLK